MEFVLDTSVAHFFFSKGSFFRTFSVEKELDFISINELFIELEKNSSRICTVAKITRSEFNETLEDIKLFVETKSFSNESLSKAASLISHKNDVPFLALALELKLPILSNDKHFKEQKEVAVYSLSELKELFKESE